MKNLLLVFCLIPITLLAQQEVPDRYWLDDSNYEDVVNGINCYPNWKDLADRPDVDYYRVDIAKAPAAKKKYRIRMAPTMFIITRDNLIKFKAGLDLEFPVSVEEVNEAIEEAQNSNRF